MGGSKMSKLLALVIAVLLLAAAFLAGWSLGQKSGGLMGPDGAPVSCVDSDIIERLSATGVLPPDIFSEEPVHALSGEATASGADYVDLTAQISIIDPPVRFRATTDENTEIVIQRAKTSAQLQAEMEAFQAQLDAYVASGSSEVPPEPPAQTVEETAEASDIEAGMYVTVTTEANARESAEFLATSIVAY
ncbi:hypothetical protein ACFL26_02560, partial [Patescibacteria group bacterium]